MTTSPPMALSETNVPTSTSNDLKLSSYLQELRRKHNLILRKEESLMKKRQKVAAEINLLEKLALRPLSADEEEAGSAGKRGRGLVACQSNLTPPISKSPLLGTPAQGEESVGKLTVNVESMQSPSEKGKETSKGPRYLCVLNGCVVCCLDLNLKPKQEPFSDTGYVPPIPKIATLKLLEEGLPVSGGLLKLGSHAYLIGGQEFPADAFKDPIFLRHCARLPDRRGIPKGFDLYNAFLSSYGARGTSRGTYRLSLADDGTTLSYSPKAKGSKIGELLEPKLWPIVEKIGGQIHVIDSVPGILSAFYDSETSSHEFLDCRRHQWKGIATMEDEEYIACATVVGDCICAKGRNADWLFDSKRKEWLRRPKTDCLNPFTVGDVWGILDCGMARCYGQFPQEEEEEGGSKDPLYVLVGVVWDYYRQKEDSSTHALAYLVTSKGRVVCTQRLPHFFDEYMKPLSTMYGTMIDVDQEYEGKPRMMCSIANGTALINGRACGNKRWNYLFINIFYVEMLTDAVSKVGRLLGKKGRKTWPVELEFVRVHNKDRYIYKTDAKLEQEADLGQFTDLKACFL